MNQSPRILLLGDYSNCHNALATGLRRLGCNVTLASDGSKWMQCDRQIDISRRPGRLGGLDYWLRMNRLLRGPLSGFDIVAIHDVNFLDLKPRRMRPLFDLLKRRNGRVFLTAMSTDLAFLDMLQAPDSPLRYSEWFVDGKPSRHHLAARQEWDEWHGQELIDYQNYVFDRLDGAVSVLYEYHLGIERRMGTDRVAYGGIPVDLQQFPPVELPERPEKVRFFLGRVKTHKLVKGSDLLEIAAKRVIERHPGKAELQIVENVPFAQFTNLMRSSSVVLDQIYSYTPATTALMAMAYGIPTVSGAESDYYRFIAELENQPIINAPTELEPLTNALEQLVLNPEQIRSRGIRSREFVAKHNACEVVAKRFLDFWTR